MTTDQSRPVSRAFTERLREVLTARLPQDPRWVVWVDGVVAELAGGEDIEAFPLIEGRCPACGRASLFRGSGGWVTCSHLDCTSPEAASDLLEHSGVVLSRDDALAIATALNGGTWVTDSDAAAARRAAMVDRLRAEARR